MTQPLIEHWPQAAVLLTQPQNLGDSMACLMEMVDEMWFLAGDRAVDVSALT